MNLAPDDTGSIREFHKKASGLTDNFRDASGGTGGKQTWRQEPTLIQTPAKVSRAHVLNPFSRRMTRGDVVREGRDGKAGSSKTLRSPSSRPTQKRRKLGDHENVVSRYFDGDPTQRRGTQAAPSAPSSTSSHTAGANTDAIIIDGEDDAPATDDKRPKPTTLRTPSPDPMDIIATSPGPSSYAFDQNRPSPMHQFSLSYEGTRNPPKDGPSTARLRNTMKLAEARPSGSGSRLDDDGDGDDVQPARVSPTLRFRTAQTAQAEASFGRSNVKQKVAFFERDDPPRHLDLQVLSRKNGMRPKQRNVAPLPLQQRDIDATRPSGFVSGSKPSKGKAAASSVSIHLPLKEWSIGAVIPPQDVAPEPVFNLTWESEVLKVRHVNGSTLFELQVKSGSVDNVKYVDIKRTKIPGPLIQIHPSPMASVQNHTTRTFKPGSSDLDGLLTFKFDKSASGWDNDVYVGLVQKLVDALVVKDGKSILDEPAARAVWETVTRVHEQWSLLSDPEPMLVDIPKQSPSNPSLKTRSRLRPRPDTTAVADIFVRRSARLSEAGEPKRFSPKPDPDEVILGYRSGTGSLNITNGDIGRLKPGEFLNDTLIEFGLKLWLADLQESNPELASQVHVFNSFFYKKLSTKIPEDGYHSVRKWTSKFDIFQKKYIIVPINENLHWYLAIIYLPEYTLLPRPAQGTNVQARRSTRRLGVVVDSVDTQQPKPAPGQSLSPDPDPPPDGHAAPVAPPELPDPETPRTDDQKSEIDVERMVESACTPMDPAATQAHGQAGPASPDTLVTHCPDSPTLVYPQSSPRSPAARLSSSEPRGDEIEQSNRGASAGGSELDTIQKSGIPPSTFYGGKPQGKEDRVAPPQLADMDNRAPPEIEIEEDEVMGNPESEHEEVVAEPPRTYIYTFDSLASKHPQAVKRLSRYLLMEAHDKKQLAEDTLTEPKGMQALVPAQTNYCDCGIYLLHFAKTFMKDPRVSSDIIRSRSSPQKGRRVPHEHWDEASVGSSREELTARILSMSEEWKKQRGEQGSAGIKNETDATAAPQDQQQQQQPPSRGDPTPTTASSRAGDETDSDIEVLGSPQKGPPSRGTRRDSGLVQSRKKGPAARVRG